MITLFELKHHAVLGRFYRIPYFIKNTMLLLVLASVLTLNYLIIYRREAVTVENVYKMLAGLNSHTFNFLSGNDESLMINTKLKSISVARAKPVDFYSSCVSLSRPCLLPSMAKTWPAYTLWPYMENGYDYLSERLGDQ